MIINTRTHFYANDFFELFCIENDFVEILQSRAKCQTAMVLKILLDVKFQWQQEGLNCEYRAYKLVT